MSSIPGEAAGSPGHPARTAASARSIDQMSPDELRRELGVLRERQRQVAELLECTAPERIIHDLRNVLNEVSLLRILAEESNS